MPPTPSGGSFAPFALEFVYEKSCRTLLLHEHPSPFFPVFLSSHLFSSTLFLVAFVTCTVSLVLYFLMCPASSITASDSRSSLFLAPSPIISALSSGLSHSLVCAKLVYLRILPHSLPSGSDPIQTSPKTLFIC